MVVVYICTGKVEDWDSNWKSSGTLSCLLRLKEIGGGVCWTAMGPHNLYVRLAKPIRSIYPGTATWCSYPTMNHQASMLPCLLRMRPVQVPKCCMEVGLDVLPWPRCCKELRKLHFSWQVPPSQEEPWIEILVNINESDVCLEWERIHWKRTIV